MPKQIADVKKNLILATKHILKEEGYYALSMRRVAAECSIAVGTVYNYVHNKEEMLALVMVEDWRAALDKMSRAVQECENLKEGFCGILRALSDFVGEYDQVWKQYGMTGASLGAVSSRHLRLRNQIQDEVNTLLLRFRREDLFPIAPLLAEMVLTVTMQPDLDENSICMLVERIS